MLDADSTAGYKNNETGRVNAIWPGSSLHYQQVIEQPRYEDFDLAYFDNNPWAHLGMGWTVQDRLGPKQADMCPYLSLDNIDPKWYVRVRFKRCLAAELTGRHRHAAMGGEPGVLKEQLEAFYAKE